jgi:acetyl-CoA carboxylase carboxyl transferase subunit alpha
VETHSKTEKSDSPIWEKVLIARAQDRPTALDYAQRLFTNFIELHGDRGFRDDPSIISGIAGFEDRTVAVIGHQKGKSFKDRVSRNFGMPHPEGYRKALRVMRLAERFKMPIITFIDTPGAFPGIEAEERGQIEAVARNIMEMFQIKVPIVSFVIGEGGSGGALAIGVGDRIYMLENSIYSVISPEACAAILWEDAGRAPEAAKSLNITASDLLRLKIVDGTVEEPAGGVQKDFSLVVSKIKSILSRDLELLCKKNTGDLINDRYEKFRKIGPYKE